MEKKNLLVAHGDLDGIISAVCAIQRYELEMDKTEVVFVQPFTVDRVEIPDEVERIFVVDVAVNNRYPFMTESFISRIGERLEMWADHHQGWATLWGGGRYNPWHGTIVRLVSTTESDFLKKAVIKEGAPSCAELIGGDPELLADATAADTRKGELSPRAQLIERAMKADMSDDNIRQMAVKWLLGEETARECLEEAAKKYAEIQAETEKLTATYQVTGNVALVDARKSNHQYDLTQLLLAGQKLAPFAVTLTVHPNQGEGLTIATSRRDVNLVELFGLGSGAPFRVSLPIQRQEEALAKLETA